MASTLGLPLATATAIQIQNPRSRKVGVGFLHLSISLRFWGHKYIAFPLAQNLVTIVRLFKMMLVRVGFQLGRRNWDVFSSKRPNFGVPAEIPRARASF